MGLGIILHIDREVIEEVTVTRIEDFRGIAKVHRYRVKHEGLFMGQLSHLYSDGALVLAQKALQLVNASLP